MKEDKTILVLGGTGAIGSFTVKLLDAQGYHVYVTSRKKRLLGRNITCLVGNAHNDVFLERCLKMKLRWFAIIDFMNYETDEFSQRYQKFLEATKQYVFISSSRVYANSDKPLTESSPRLLDTVKDKTYLKSDDYALAKARCEDLLRSSGLYNWTIIRPYMSYFKNRMDLIYFPKELWLYRIIRGRSIVFYEDLGNKMTTLTYGNDVGRGIVSIIGKEETLGSTFHVTSSIPYSWKDVLLIYKEAIEKKGYNFKCKTLKQISTDEYIYRYDRSYNRMFCNDAIGKFIDTTTFTDLKKGISDSVNSFLDNPSWLKIDWKKQAYWDRLTSERTPMSEISGFREKLAYLFFRYVLSYPTTRFFYHKLKYKFN